jgi:hypothetical protein
VPHPDTITDAFVALAEVASTRHGEIIELAKADAAALS